MERADDLERWVNGICYRLQHLAGRVERDLAGMREVAPVERRFAERLAEYPNGSEPDTLQELWVHDRRVTGRSVRTRTWSCAAGQRDSPSSPTGLKCHHGEMNLSTMSYCAADGVAHLRLDRPEGANAMNVDFSKDIREVMIAIEHDPIVKSIAVTAEGKVFSAGGDLKEFASLGDELPAIASGLSPITTLRPIA